MDEELERRVCFLRAAHTDWMAHTERGLLDHLLGTRQVLMDWRAQPAVCDAGLFHSVYGTEHYAPAAIGADIAESGLFGWEQEKRLTVRENNVAKTIGRNALILSVTQRISQRRLVNKATS